jgi:hypothetical protein
VGERGLREVLVPLLAVAVVGAAGGYALRGWVVSESSDAADARLASDASVSSAPEGASNSGELAGLRAQLREERDRRTRVEAKLRDLREEVAQLVSAYQEEAEREEAAAGTLIEGLEDKGLVERRRSQEDRRLQLVSITDAGRQVVDEVDHMAADLGTEYRRGITRSERLQLVSVLQRLRDNLRRIDATGGLSDHG